jgi:hypothetical protein
MGVESAHIAQPTKAARRIERALTRARRTPARPLAPELAEDLGRQFRHDFSRVRVRSESDAARVLGADAFTIGQEIVFAPGRFAPHTIRGRELIAHELAHTIQHGDRDGIAGAFRLSRPGDALETQADSAARCAATGVMPPVVGPSPHAAGLVSLKRTAAYDHGASESALLDSPEDTYQTRVDAMLEQLRTDPSDRSGRLRRQLQRVSPDTRAELMDRLREKVTDAQWAQLSSALTESLPSEAEHDTTTAPEPETTTEERSPEEKESEPKGESAEAPKPVAADAAVEGKAPPEAAAAPSPEESLEKDPGPEGPPVKSDLDAEQVEQAAKERGPAPAEVPEEEQKIGKASGGATAAPTVAEGGEASPEQSGAVAAEPEAAPATEVTETKAVESSPEGAAETTGASVEPGATAEPPVEAETPREGPIEEAKEPSTAAGPITDEAEAPAAETQEASAPEAGGGADAESAIETPLEEQEQTAAGPPPDLAPEAEATANAAAQSPSESAAVSEPEPPMPAAIKDVAAAGDGSQSAPQEEINPSAGGGAAGAIGSGGGPATSEGSAAEAADLELEGATSDTEQLAGPAPPETEQQAPAAGAETAAAGPEAGGCAGGGEAPSAEAGGDGGGGGGACGGGGAGGGGAAEEPAAAAAPDVSQSDPAQAMGAIKGLPPVQMQQALGGVSQASTKAVSDQRQELSTNPPQMQRPSGVPAQRDPAMPVGPVAPANTAGAGDVERTAEGEALAVPQPAALPAPPPNPTAGLRGPRVPGEAEMSEADVAKAQSAISDLPTTDPALNVTAGDPPTLDLAGDADPTLVADQRAKVDQGTTDARVQGQADAAEPLGENNIYPTVPAETLKADTGGEGLGVGGTLAACAKGGGKALSEAQAKAGGAAAGGGGAEAVSIIANEEKGPEIQGAVEQAQGDMVAKQDEHATKVADEKAKSQQQVEELIEDNAAQQKDERTSARKESIKLRTEWDGEQRKLVDTGRKDAAKAAADAAGKIQTEEREGNKKAQGHIDKGNEEAADARRDAEKKAAEEKKKGEKESSGFFGWLGSKVTSFFNAIKDAIQSAFEFARTLVKKAIEAAKKLAVEAIELARKAVVGLIKAAGDVLIAVGDVVLAGFPEARDRFRKGVQDRVDSAVDTVNKLADDLKAGVQKLLDLLGDAINGLLGLLECAYLAAVDVVAGVVKGAIDFANKFIQLVGEFAALIKDVAADPGGWLSKLGSAVVSGIKNCLWSAFKSAVKNWFNSKLEEVLGLGMAIWKLLFKGCMKMADIGKMAWQALLTAIPIALIQILIEKLVAMIVPAAGAILTIIEGLRAAWGTVSRIITAFALFFAFLKAVKSGNAAGPFAAAVAAAAVVVIDFVANWLLMRLRKPAGAVAGKLKALAQKIGKGLKAAGQAVKRGAKVAAGAIRRGAAAVGRGIKRGVKAVGRGLKRAGQAIARSKIGQAIARSRVGRVLARAVGRVRSLAARGKAAFQRGKEKFKQWREKRKQDREKRKAERRARARKETIAALERMLGGSGMSSLRFRAQLYYLKVRWGWKSLRVQPVGAGRFAVEGAMSPGEILVGDIIQNVEVIPGGFTTRVKGGGEARFVVGREQEMTPEIRAAFAASRAAPTHGQPREAPKGWQLLETPAQAQFARTIARPQGLTMATERNLPTEWFIPGGTGAGRSATGFVRPEALARGEQGGQLSQIAMAEATQVADIRAQGKNAKGAMRKHGQFAGYLSALKRESIERGVFGKIEVHIHYYSDREPPEEAKALLKSDMTAAGLPNVTVFWHIV